MVVNVASDMLSIESYEYRDYEPPNPAALNYGQAIQFHIQNQNVYTQPSWSFLLVDGRLHTVSAAPGNQYAVRTLVSLINNAIAFMFSQTRYLLNHNEIEIVMNPWQATSLKGMLSYGDDLSTAEGLNMCWHKDTTVAAAVANSGFEVRRQLIIANPDPIGTFSFCVHLKHLFGFYDDYRMVLYGVKQSLLLSRQTDNEAIFLAQGAQAGRIILSKLLSWMVPHITPSVERRNIRFKQVESKIKILVTFLAMQSDSLAVPQLTSFSWQLSIKSGTEKPRWLLEAFQTG